MRKKKIPYWKRKKGVAPVNINIFWVQILKLQYRYVTVDF